jgi:hypothetical protein
LLYWKRAEPRDLVIRPGNLRRQRYWRMRVKSTTLLSSRSSRCSGSMRKKSRRPDVSQARVGRGRVLAGNCIGRRFTILDIRPGHSPPRLGASLPPQSAFEARHCPAPRRCLARAIRPGSRTGLAMGRGPRRLAQAAPAIGRSSSPAPGSRFRNPSARPWGDRRCRKAGR